MVAISSIRWFAVTLTAHVAGSSTCYSPRCDGETSVGARKVNSSIDFVLRAETGSSSGNANVTWESPGSGTHNDYAIKREEEVKGVKRFKF